MNEVKLAKKLLTIDAVSGNEKKIGEVLAKRLSKNFTVKLQEAGTGFNILAYRGTPRLVFTTHLDTVPGQLPIKEDNDWLYGRGACDAKGIIAAMVCASEEAVAQGLSDFGLLFDVNEETDFAGIKKAIKLVKPEFVVVGEPTSSKVVVAQKGLLGIKVVCTGKSAHGSTPEKGKSAINILVEQLSKINKITWPEDKALGKTTINIGLVLGGTSSNTIPNYAEAILEFRTTTKNTRILALIKRKIPGLKFQIKCSFDPVKTRSQEFLKLFSQEKISVPYFTEMYFWAKSSEVVVFGPGNIKYAHSDNERILKTDITNGKLAYLELIRKISRQNKG